MRIMFYITYWFPYEGALTPLLGDLCQELSKKGHGVSVLTSFPHFRKGRSEKWKQYKGKLYQKENWNGVEVIRSYIFAPEFKSSKLGILFRFLNFLSFSISSFIVGLFVKRPDVIFAVSSPPLISGVVSYLIALFKRTKFIYNIQDLYPDIAVKCGVITNLLLIWILRSLESFVYSKASACSVISEAMKINLISKKVPPEKIYVIPNFCDTEFVIPLPKDNDFSRKFGIQDKFVAIFAGNIGIPQGVEDIIESARILKDNSDIVFVFVGRGENKEKMEKLTEDLGLSNVKFLPLQPFATMPQVWAAADVSLVPLKKGISTDAVPSKIFGIMASSRPVIAMIDEGSEIWKIVESAQGGICVPPENPELLAEAVLKVYKNKDLRETMGENGRRFVVDKFSKKLICQKYEELFLDIGKR